MPRRPHERGAENLQPRHFLVELVRSTPKVEVHTTRPNSTTLQTDSTRIATLEIGGDFMPQHLGIKKDWHGLSHHGNDAAKKAKSAIDEAERLKVDLQLGEAGVKLASMFQK